MAPQIDISLIREKCRLSLKDNNWDVPAAPGLRPYLWLIVRIGFKIFAIEAVAGIDLTLMDRNRE